MNNLNPLILIYRLIKNRPTVPRWIIFMLDLAICALSLFFAYFLRFNLDFDTVIDAGILLPIVILSALNIIFFRVFRTYEGIIRLSSAQGGVRCVSAVFCSSVVLLIFIILGAIFNFAYIVPTSVLFIYFFTASFLIFAYRSLIKSLYDKSLKIMLTAENAIVFSSTKNVSLLKNAIESIPAHQFKVIAFVDDNENLWGKSIDSARIYSWNQAKNITEKFNIKYFFLASDDLDIEIKNEIVDHCVANNISVKVIPAVHKWVDGQLQTRQIKNLRIEDLLNRPSIKLASEHIKMDLLGKRIMVTGAAGSIGSEIVRQLATINVELLILCDTSETGLYELHYQLKQACFNIENIIVRICNVRHSDNMENIFKTYNPQIIFHAAAYKHVPLMEMHPCEAVLNNVMGTRVVADLSIKYAVDRFIFVSTDKAINPTNVMGASKRIAEMYLRGLHNNQKQVDRPPRNENEMVYRGGKTKFITTRFGNVLGSNGSVIPRFQDQIDNGGPVTVTHPDITRFFMTIPEACSLVLEAGTMGKGGEIYVFDMGEPVRIVDLAKKMIRLAGFIPGKEIKIDFMGLRPGEKLFEELLYNREEIIKTHHKKIMISMVNNDGGNISDSVNDLISLAAKGEKLQVVKEMKLIVKEFKSKNSIYEALDKEIKLEVVPVLESLKTVV